MGETKSKEILLSGEVLEIVEDFKDESDESYNMSIYRLITERDRLYGKVEFYEMRCCETCV